MSGDFGQKFFWRKKMQSDKGPTDLTKAKSSVLAQDQFVNDPETSCRSFTLDVANKNGNSELNVNIRCHSEFEETPRNIWIILTMVVEGVVTTNNTINNLDWNAFSFRKTVQLPYKKTESEVVYRTDFVPHIRQQFDIFQKEATQEIKDFIKPFVCYSLCNLFYFFIFFVGLK